MTQPSTDSQERSKATRRHRPIPRDATGDGRVRINGRYLAIHDASEAHGRIDVSNWDTEELIRGKLRDKDGSFRGKPPKWLPAEVVRELARRVQSDLAHDLRALAMQHLVPAYELALKIATGEKELTPEQLAAARLQLEAAKDLADRFITSRKSTVEHTGEVAFEGMIRDVTIDRTLSDDDIIDAEFVEEDDELGWDDEF